MIERIGTDAQGNPLKAKVVDFEAMDPETPQRYRLADGSILILKMNLLKVSQLIQTHGTDWQPKNYVVDTKVCNSVAQPSNENSRDDNSGLEGVNISEDAA